MACRIPGCSTRYWDKNNKLLMFTAASDADYKTWEGILSKKYGVEDFGPNDKICILHFEQSALERTRTIYHSGGSSKIVTLAKPKLASGAFPTVFPSKIPRKKKKKCYDVIKNTEILAKQRQIFEENQKDHVMKKAIKRKLVSKEVPRLALQVTENILPQGVNIVPDSDDNIREGVTSEKKRKTNNLYGTVVNAIHNNEKVSSHLSKKWIPILHSDNFVMWSLWKEDRSCIEKSLTLHEDLKVEVFVNGKQISIPESKNIVEMNDLQTLFAKVARISPCMKADGNSSDSVCLHYVTRGFGRPRLRCSPCCVVQRNFTRRIGSKFKQQQEKKISKRLRVNCSILRRKSISLQDKINKLKQNVRSLQKKCAKADKTAVDAAIEKLSFSEQAAVRCCLAASQVKNMRGMRYTTQWVYECLLLRIKSRKTYDHMRKRRILVLPDVSTLNRYIKRISGCYGFKSSLFKVLSEKTKKMKSDEVRGVLLVDEMKLTKSLAFNRRNLKVEGFTDLGKYTPQHQRGKKGDHALVFMFQPFKGKWVQALGCFLSKGSASGTILHQLIIESIVLAERSGLRIDAVTTDGAAWNRNMWKLFGVTKDNVSVPHVVDSKRRLWFFSDFPHLIKCMRNFFTHSGRVKEKGIWTPGGIVSLQHWYGILKVENESTYNLKVNFKLRKEHLDPQYFKKMNVALAFQFFGVADAMELFKDQHSDLANCEPSILLCRKVKALITAMNSRTAFNSLKPGNEMWKNIEDFIEYLDKWEEESKKRGFDFLPDPTCYGLQITLRAALEICKFLVNECEGFSYLMTARLNQDSLERFFGMMRDCCGSNDHPDSTLFIQMYRLVSTYSLVKPPKGSNISGGEILDILVKLKDIENADERWEQWTGQLDTIVDKGTGCDQLVDAAILLRDHDYFGCTTSDYVLTYISGFVARKATRFVTFITKNSCEECAQSLLLDPKEAIPESHKLIQLKSHGYLKHPSKKLFQLISVLEQGTLQAIVEHDLNAETLFEVTKTIEELPATPSVGCSQHASTLTHRIIAFFLTTRMYFLCKQANKNDSAEREQTREKRKFSKLTTAPDIISVNDGVLEKVSEICKTQRSIALKPSRKRKNVKKSTKSIKPDLNDENYLPTVSKTSKNGPKKRKALSNKTNQV